ncbi:MAG: 2-phosphosulfolactate phosphatase [Pseudohongiellaceae bacterium]|jgi:2-phosphosulfolactate phosphatase
MHVEVALIQDLVPADLGGAVSTVVIDVLRATTTVVYALEAGCAVVTPVGSVDEARAKAALTGALLAGERGGLPLDGFDFGNSPPDFTAERCAGRPVVLTTTNGTQAVRRCLGAQSVWAAALVNAEATARALVESGAEEVLLVCAGSGGEMAADDVAAAGCIAGSLALLGAATPGDGARIAAALFDAWKHDLRGLLRRSLSGQKLTAAGLDADLDHCARVDSVPMAVKLDGTGGFRRV